jgi:acyl-CoA synthetase (AMP-forming)/AMP-acid ligase II
MDIAILDSENRPLPPGETGEIGVRGNAVFAGYFENEEANAKAFAGGWFHTGDLGHLDARGFLYITGRASDMYISGGSNVYPREVEEALLRHPGVRAAAVVGRPDPEWGEAVVAFVVPADDGAPPPAEELDRTCLQAIARYKRPKDYRFVDALPTNNYGKVVKRELRERLRPDAASG